MGLTKLGVIGILSALFLDVAWAQNRTVILGGTGPSPYFEQALDQVADSLKTAGVQAKVLSGAARARTAVVDEMKDQGYTNLLYLTLDSPRDGKSNAARGNVVASCFVDGAKVWEEKSNSPLVFPLSRDHEVQSMINGIVKKIGKRVGGPCLLK